jgi:hypothetical protein
MTTEDQLARTVLLLQTDLEIDDAEIVLRALLNPVVVLVADAATVKTFAGQVAISTSAMLAARSGHQVFIDTPDAPLVGFQPPLEGQTFHEAMSRVGSRLVDGATVAIGCPLLPADIAFVFGDGNAGIGTRAAQTYSVGCTNWSGSLRKWPLQCGWFGGDWPVGPMAAATLVAAESFKVAGRALLPHSSNAGHFRDLFAPAAEATFKVAPESTPMISELGDFDIISAGAVSNGFLYAMMRLPKVTGRGRAFDEDISEDGNRNRNMLLTPNHLRNPKIQVFEGLGRGIEIKGLPRHFVASDLPSLVPRVVVGVDDIPTRWLLAGAKTEWMGVGATTHFAAMASVHYPYAACAACLHPRDEVIEGPTPTIAFVSFMSGLMVAGDFLRDVGRAEAKLASHYRYVVPLQMDGEWHGNVAPVENCPAGCPASKIRA